MSIDPSKSSSSIPLNDENYDPRSVEARTSEQSSTPLIVFKAPPNAPGHNNTRSFIEKYGLPPKLDLFGDE